VAEPHRRTSVPVLAFVFYCGGFVYERQNQRDTGKYWFLVRLWIRHSLSETSRRP